MNRNSILIIFPFLLIVLASKGQQGNYLKIFLDTKKFAFTPCNLNADGSGGASPLTKVYMHSGLCSHDPNNPTDASANKTFCLSQIIPLHSLVWQHVVGNWGSNPLDDGIGQMADDGNGIWSLEMNTMEDYFSSSDVSSATEPVSGVTSTPLSPGYKGYVIGIVFRNFDGSIVGRDSSCNDIFIIDMDTPDPKVVQSDPLGVWVTSPVSFYKAPVGNQNFTPGAVINTYPNPFSSSVRIEYMLMQNEKNLTVTIYDILGNEVAGLFEGEKIAGKDALLWNGRNKSGKLVEQGNYFCVFKGGKFTSARRITFFE